MKHGEGFLLANQNDIHMKRVRFLQKASFVALLVFSTGDSWSNLVALCVCAMVLGITSYKLRSYV